MPTDIRMPAVSPTMEKGTLARWLVPLGSHVEPGQAIAELETDKASVELEAEASGVLAEIVVAEGTADVPVGSVLARLEPADGQVATAPAAAATGPAQPAPAPAPAPVEDGTPAATGDAPQAPPHTKPASPLARRLALQLGIDLAQVQGSGPRGRVLKSDLEALDARLRAAPPTPAAQPAAREEPAPPPPAGVPLERTPLSNMRRAIARRLGASKRTVPHFYMSVDANMEALLALREQCNAQSAGARLSVNDFVIRACALGLRDVPEANVQFGGDVLYRFQRVDISVAVAVEDGLLTPVVRDAANKTVRAIATEMRDLSERARRGTLHPSEFEGGTFSVSNLGMYGIKQFDAVINPPQAGILAVGAITPRAEPVGEEVKVQRVATLTLSCDHRVIDGAVGAKLLQTIGARLEQPLEILLD